MKRRFKVTCIALAGLVLFAGGCSGGGNSHAETTPSYDCVQNWTGDPGDVSEEWLSHCHVSDFYTPTETVPPIPTPTGAASASDIAVMNADGYKYTVSFTAGEVATKIDTMDAKPGEADLTAKVTGGSFTVTNTTPGRNAPPLHIAAVPLYDYTSGACAGKIARMGGESLSVVSSKYCTNDVGIDATVSLDTSGPTQNSSYTVADTNLSYGSYERTVPESDAATFAAVLDHPSAWILLAGLGAEDGEYDSATYQILTMSIVWRSADLGTMKFAKGGKSGLDNDLGVCKVDPGESQPAYCWVAN